MNESNPTPDAGTPDAPRSDESAAPEVPRQPGVGELGGTAQPPLAADGTANLDAILDVPVNLSLEVGRSKISIRNLLRLNQGSVVELDRLAGEPLDVLVNGTLVARGEVVVVNEKFGIRLTDVVSAQERIKRIQ